MATVTPGYWYCPRCLGKDLYQAPRQVGSVSFGRVFDGFDANPDQESIGVGQRAIQANVWICRSCGERAVYQKKIKHLTPSEQKRSDNNFGAFMLVFAAFFIIVGFSMINSVADTGQSVDPFAWISLILGAISAFFGVISLQKKDGKTNLNPSISIADSPSPTNIQSPDKTDSLTSQSSSNNNNQEFKLLSCSKCRTLRTSLVSKCPYCERQS